MAHKIKFVRNELFTNDYTSVFCEQEKDQDYGAPNNFYVCSNDENEEGYLAEVHFQDGPIKECGVNGISNEDAILMVLTRLEHFQNTKYACKENDEAIKHLYAAIDSLKARTKRRKAAGIEGTSKIDKA